MEARPEEGPFSSSKTAVLAVELEEIERADIQTDNSSVWGEEDQQRAKPGARHPRASTFSCQSAREGLSKGIGDPTRFTARQREQEQGGSGPPFHVQRATPSAQINFKHTFQSPPLKDRSHMWKEESRRQAFPSPPSTARPIQRSALCE